MIVLNIFSKSKTQIEEVVTYLLKEKMISHANIDWDRNRYFNENGMIIKRKVHLLNCITKALLFTEIDNYLREKFPSETPEIFSTPIVNIDFDLAQKVINQTVKR